MLKQMSATVMFSLLIFSNVLASQKDVHQQLKNQGFVEIENRDFLRKNYTELYEKFDTLITMTHEGGFAEFLSNSEKQFSAMDAYSLRYCAAPPSFRDPHVHDKKINNRIYFQFIKEHYDFIKANYPEAVQKYPQLIGLFDDLSTVDTVSKKLFTDIVDEMEPQCPGIKKLMYGDNQELTVVTKVVRYKKTDDWHEKPHFDKCGLTLIWDNDDNHKSLMVCKDTLHPTRAALKLPERKYADQADATSTLLIGGLCLASQGIDINPTLHYVGPIENEYRHSIISFLLVPGIDTSNMQTEFIESKE